MDKQKAVQKMTEVMAKFVGYTGKGAARRCDGEAKRA